MKSEKVHGTYTIKLIDQIIVVDAHGPFNKEGVEFYHQDLKSSINYLQATGKPWSQIIVLYKESLFTPEAAIELSESNAWRKTKGLSQCCVVLVDPVGTSILKRQLTNIYENAGVPMKICESVDEALSLLNKLSD